jgi:hypothetical protein
MHSPPHRSLSGSLREQPCQRSGLLSTLTHRFGRSEVPRVCSKSPTHIREATKRFMWPGRLACWREDHELSRRLPPDPSNVQGLVALSQHGDRIVDLRSAKEGVCAGQMIHACATISLSRTARSPKPDDLMR